MKNVSSLKSTGREDSKVSSVARSINESIKPYLRYKDYSKAIINSLEDELIVIDRDYRIIQANKVVLSRRGKRRSRVIGKYCYDIAQGQPEFCCPPRHECPLKAVWETGKPARVTHHHVYRVIDHFTVVNSSKMRIVPSADFFGLMKSHPQDRWLGFSFLMTL